MNGQTVEGKQIRIDWDVGLDKKKDTIYRSRGGRGYAYITPVCTNN